MSQWRVYLGKHPTVFLTGGVGHVVPGQVFPVPDEHVAAFDARRDVGVPAPRRSGRKTSDSGEAASAVPGDGGSAAATDAANGRDG